MNNDPTDELLTGLQSLEIPTPSDAARQRALAASQLAFEAGKTAAPDKSSSSPQALGLMARLRSIFPLKIGDWTMDTRIAIGGAALALLAIPLGWQLYSTTAMTPLVPPIAIEAPEPDIEIPDIVALPSVETKLDDTAAPAKAVAPQQPETSIAEERAVAAPKLEAPMVGEELSQAATAGAIAADGAMAPSADMAVMPSLSSVSTESYSMPQTQPSGDEFTSFEESPVKAVAEEPVSTFSIDVDTASYSYVRMMLGDGYVPEPDAVRIEELINYFPYSYPAADTTDLPFKPTMAIYPTPWNPATQLLHIGIKGYVPPAEAVGPSNLVFLLDTSGSMDEPNKLPLLKRAFGLLVDQLGDGDTVSIVAYAGSAGVVLEPTKASDKQKILSALDTLAAGGSTAGAEGIELAYTLAEQNFIDGGNNRVILATDGDFNVGIDDPDALIDFIKTKRDGGVFLSVLGFGQGNLDDATMQALAQNGNGNAAYIDSFREAQKVLVEEMGSTLVTIAKDVKIQVEFNPAFVSEYRLIGYETRALNREDFNNDAVDAGEIGAGHTVTAIYEIVPAGSGAQLIDPLRYGNGETPAAPATTPDAAPPASGELGFLKIRYKAPDGDVSKLIEVPITSDLVVDDIAKVSDDLRFAAAVAAFGQKLKGSNYGEMSWDAIRDLAQGARGEDEAGYRAEFVQLVRTAATLE